MGHINILAAFILIIALVGCETIPPDAFRVTETSLEQRQVQTRLFHGIEEPKLLAACSNVLQDMGYQLEDAEVELGVLTASKERSAVNAGQVVGMVLLAALGGGATPIDKDQTIRVAVVSKPLYTGGVRSQENFAVRATFQRVVRRSDGTQRVEPLGDQELYEGFFAQLSKSVFIEAQEI